MLFDFSFKTCICSTIIKCTIISFKFINISVPIKFYTTIITRKRVFFFFIVFNATIYLFYLIIASIKSDFNTIRHINNIRYYIYYN